MKLYRELPGIAWIMAKHEGETSSAPVQDAIACR